jgi:hypothetical protein
VSQTSRTLRVFPPFQYGGKSYKVEARSFATEAAIELWLEQRALQSIQRSADVLTPHEYAELLRLWSVDCASLTYSFGGVAYHRAMLTSEGLKQRCYLDLKQANPRITEEAVDVLWRDETPLPAGRPGPEDRQAGGGNLRPPAAGGAGRGQRPFVRAAGGRERAGRGGNAARNRRGDDDPGGLTFEELAVLLTGPRHRLSRERLLRMDRGWVGRRPLAAAAARTACPSPARQRQPATAPPRSAGGRT